jgi:hypothetical protein
MTNLTRPVSMDLDIIEVAKAIYWVAKAARALVDFVKSILPKRK